MTEAALLQPARRLQHCMGSACMQHRTEQFKGVSCIMLHSKGASTLISLHAGGTVSNSNIAADASGGDITSTGPNSAVSDAGDGGQIEIGQGGEGVGG